MCGYFIHFGSCTYPEMQMCTYIDLSFCLICVYTNRTIIGTVQKVSNLLIDTALSYRKHTYIVTFRAASSVGCLSEFPLKYLCLHSYLSCPWGSLGP